MHVPALLKLTARRAPRIAGWVTVAALAAVTLGAGASSAAAVGTGNVTTLTSSPERPAPGQPFVLTGHTDGIIGTARYVWDLDGDGVCETATGTRDSITITRPLGGHRINTCVTDDVGSLYCEHSIVVGPEPAIATTFSHRDEDRFFRSGITVSATWNVPLLADYEASYTPAGSDPGRVSVPLVVSVVRAPGAPDRITIAPPPASARVLGSQPNHAFIQFGWGIQPSDPLYGAQGIRYSGARTSALLITRTQPATGAAPGTAKPPKLRITRLVAKGRALRVTVLAPRAGRLVVRLVGKARVISVFRSTVAPGLYGLVYRRPDGIPAGRYRLEVRLHDKLTPRPLRRSIVLR